MESTDIILTDEDDIALAANDIAVGNTYWQEVKNIIRLIPGQLKQTPMLGPNLITLLNSKVSEEWLFGEIKRNIEADGKDYDFIKNNIRLKL